MSIKIFFEIGHQANLMKTPTPQGFTHNWELFVRGVDGNDISLYVEKVVFTLHDSFPKPKRGECPKNSSPSVDCTSAKLRIFLS